MTAPGPGVVFAAAMSHAPHISAFPELAEPSQREAIYSAMSELGRQLRAADPDVLVLVSSDHFTNLSPAESTQFLVGSGSVFHGPVEDWIGIEKRQVNGSMRDAAEIFGEIAHVASRVRAAPVRLEHGVMTPLRWLDPDGLLPLVPVLQNCMIPPLPALAECYAVGDALARVAARTGLRLAVVGTGGLSHSPGAPEAGYIDEGFDREFLELLRHAEIARILGLPGDRVDRAGLRRVGDQAVGHGARRELRGACPGPGLRAGRRWGYRLCRSPVRSGQPGSPGSAPGCLTCPPHL